LSLVKEIEELILTGKLILRIKKNIYTMVSFGKMNLNSICMWKQINPQESFLKILEMFDEDGRILPYNDATGAEVLETLFSGEDNASNKIVNTVIQLVVDYNIEENIDMFSKMEDMTDNMQYNNIDTGTLIFILSEIMEIDKILDELMSAGFNVTNREDSGLMKMVRNYQERKALAMTGSLLIDEEFYDICTDNLD
jgi:uncharacterized glyoxalase superfamily protein PhnB